MTTQRDHDHDLEKVIGGWTARTADLVAEAAATPWWRILRHRRIARALDKRWGQYAHEIGLDQPGRSR